MNWYPKYVQGEPVYIKGSKDPSEVSFWDGNRQKYLVLKLNIDGSKISEEFVDENILEPVRLNEYYIYIFNFNEDELQYLKRIFYAADDRESIIVDRNKLDIHDRFSLNGILRKIENRKASKHGQDSANRNQFEMLHGLYRVDMNDSNIISFDWRRVRDVLSVHGFYPPIQDNLEFQTNEPEQ